MDEKKVFVLVQHFIEDVDVMGVFSSEDLAKKAKNDIEKLKASKYYRYWIEEWEMDNLHIDYH